MISDKNAFDAAQTVVEFCRQQRFCQNCIFRLKSVLPGSEGYWKCEICACDLREVLSNIEAKKKNHGYIG